MPIQPVGKSAPKPCNGRYDKLSCQIAEGMARFGTTTTRDGHEAHTITRSRRAYLDQIRYLDPLDRSPAIREVNRLRILARQIARFTDPCEPNYIYVGRAPIFNLGPAFVSSTRFMADGRPTTNVLVLEDARAPYHVPVSLITKDSLIRNKYYDIVVAHELAHGLMQDLYGVDGFTALEKSFVSRDGHFASAVTDPGIAWVEGFAEGFEAYLGEKYLSAGDQATPFLAGVLSSIKTETEELPVKMGWRNYAVAVPRAIARTAKVVRRMDDFIAEFLKAERQRAIRENHYIMKGNLVNLAHRHDIIPASMVEEDWDDTINWEAEPTDAVYSKEGVVAHFVYRILREGLAPEMLETIRWGRPRGFWEFAEMFRATIEPEAYAKLADLYKTVFTNEGRAAVRLRLKRTADLDAQLVSNIDHAWVEREYRKDVAATPAPATLSPPRDLWIEFWTHSRVRGALSGVLDRINLSTAPPGRVHDFLGAIPLSKELRRRVLGSFVAFRDEHPSLPTVAVFVDRWKGWATRKTPELGSAVREAAARMLAMRGCFQRGCLSAK